jgi:capsular polysaccharide biosynthesis protein/Mrp family chromosome partitioning ATPase
LTKSPKHPPAEDTGVPALGRALWRTKGAIMSLAIMAGLVTFVGLAMMRPLYPSEARILIQNDESAFTRPDADQGADFQRAALDDQAVQSQMQVLTSRDLAVEVVKALDLTNNADFANDAGVGPIERFLNRIGLGLGSPRSEEEKAATAFAEHLDVFRLAKSSVIGIEYSSGDATLAAKIANQLADSYVEWQRKAKREQTKDATAWLDAQIEVLRKKVAEAEAAAEQFRSSQGLFEGSNNLGLNDMDAVPAQAVIISRAHASVLPSSPKRGPITLLVTLATILLALAYVLARELIGAPAETRDPFRAEPARAEEPRLKPRGASSAAPAEAGPSAGLSAAAGLLDRLRRGESLGPSEPDDAEMQTSPLRANDLRHYLNHRIAAAPSEAANDSIKNGAASSEKPTHDKVGPVLKSLDAVLNQILASAKAGASRALLVAGASAKVDATPEAIQIARTLVARRDQVVLVDVTRGASTVSGPLGLPRSPGFTDLAAGRAGFDEVVRIDDDTSLQVIAAGNPKVAGNGAETERFTPLFEALTQAYDRVVLHADRDVVRKLTPALKFELSVVVAVLPAGSSDKSTGEDLADFSALGCPVVAYEQSGNEPRSGLLAHVAAI